MFKRELKTVVLLGIIFCISMGSLHKIAAAEVKPDKAGKASKIQVPDKGAAIVLRAPMSKNPHVVKVSENQEEDTISGFTVSLSKNTPIFFRVDQVNTVLYTVKITVEEGGGTVNKPSGESSTVEKGGKKKDKPSGESSTVHSIIEKINEHLRLWRAKESEASKVVVKAMEGLKVKVLTVKELDSKLDEHLHRSEISEFYAGNIAENFEEIKTAAIKAAKGKFDLERGTAAEICTDIEAHLAAVHEAYAPIKANPPSWMPKDLSDTSNPERVKFVDALLRIPKKFQEIRGATWAENDSQDRLLGEKIKYVCVITPKPEYSKKLASERFVVTVISTTNLSGIYTTVGAFISNLHDESYIKMKNKIALGGKHSVSRSFGGLAHLPLLSGNNETFRVAAAVSGGIAGIASISEQSVKLDFKNAQPMLGVSAILAGKTSDSLFVVTVGGIAKSVQRLNGYKVGKPYPKDPKTLMTNVDNFGWFFSVTFSYDILGRLNRKVTGSSKK